MGYTRYTRYTRSFMIIFYVGYTRYTHYTRCIRFTRCTRCTRSFMIIFYVGYCYGRQQSFFAEAQRIMMAIQNSCAVARCIFKDREAVENLWRHLNLLHISGALARLPSNALRACHRTLRAPASERFARPRDAH